MKKYCFAALVAGLFSVVSAKDNISVIPTTLQNGVSVNSSTTDLTFYLDASKRYASCDFHLYIPTDLAVDYYDEDDEEYVIKKKMLCDEVLNPDNFALTIRRANGADYAREGYNTYLVVIYSDAGKSFRSTTLKGNLFTLRCGVTSSAKETVYPIYIDNLTLTVSGEEYNAEVASTSYVKVGSAKSGTLEVEGEITSNTAAAMASETAISELDITKCTGIPSDGIASSASVSYSRNTASAGDWGTICVPFELSSGDGIQYYAFDSMDEVEGTMNFKETATVEAGTPAVFKATPGLLNWSGSATKVAAKSGDMTGTYEDLFKQTGMYFIADNKFWKADEPITIGAFRAFFPGTISKSASFRINVAGADGIQKLEMDENGNIKEVFNLQGQHIAAPIKGQVNIINGKKVIVK